MIDANFYFNYNNKRTLRIIKSMIKHKKESFLTEYVKMKDIVNVYKNSKACVKLILL